jgi:hypothetical protein
MSTTYMALAHFAEDTAAKSNKYRKLPIHMSRFHSELCIFPLPRILLIAGVASAC